MKRRINKQLIAISLLAIVTTCVMVVAVTYDLFRKQVFDDLKSYAVLLETFVGEDLEQYERNFTNESQFQNESNLRITLIDKDGTVLFDNYAKAADMENHKGRPEISQARQQGEGTMIRHSDTIDKNTFYYATITEDGKILRMGKEVNSILNVYKSAIPPIIIVVLIISVAIVMTSRFLTKVIIKPMEEIASNMDELEQVTVYPELVPFVTKIKHQHEDILKSAAMRQEFTANVSHELKTPLTVISGYAELIENGIASEEDTTRFATEIHKHSNRLLTQINDIIRLSELDATQQEDPFIEVNLYQIAQNCVDMLELKAEKHNVSIFFDGKPSLVMGNKEMLEEVLYNLCDNAIRYNNPDGIVEVFVEPIKDKVILRVRDTGIGIDKEHQERVFERYYRVDKGRSKMTGGTGLGLAIVKHILIKHNATMELTSEKGKGTEIKVVFPMKEWL